MPVIKTQTRKFKDFDLNFKPHPNTGDVSVVTDEDAVRQSIKNLVLTKLFEKPFNPYRAGQIYELMFENLDPSSADFIEDNINDLIEQYEPRAVLRGVDVNINSEEHQINLEIRFFITSIEQETSFNIILSDNF